MTTVSSNSVNSDIAVSTTSGTVNKVISSPLVEEITVSSANGNLKILKTDTPDDITVGSENTLTYLVTEKLTAQEISAGVYKGPKGDDGETYEILVSSGLGDDVQTALDSAGSQTVRITSDIPSLDTPILIDSDQTLCFDGYTINASNSITGGAVIKNKNASDSNITIIGGIINGTAATTAIYDGVLLTNVSQAVVQGVLCDSVEITASATATGNIHLEGCDHVLIRRCQAHDSYRMGIYIHLGSHNTIDGGYFTGTHDSGIACLDSDYGEIMNVLVDNCGTSDASNITANMRHGKFINNTSINASGTNNGNGFTLGHANGYDAYNTLVIGNIFDGNAAKGIYLQGTDTKGNIISNNIITNNGVGSGGANSGGISIATGSGNKFTNNTLKGNKYGISIVNGSVGNLVTSNTIENSTAHGIKNDGQKTRIENNYFSTNTSGSVLHDTNATLYSWIGNTEEGLEHNFVVEGIPSTSTNRASNSGLRFTRNTQVNNTEVGIWLATSTTDLYGVKLATRRLTGGTDYETVISNHKGTEAGVDALAIDDSGNIVMGTIISTGGRIKNTTRVTTTYTILVTDCVVFANSDAGDYTVDLPAGVEGQTIRVINSGSSSNTITVDGDGTETIYSSLTFALEDNESIEITYNADDGWM